MDEIAGWVRWLRVARPELPEPTALTLVNAARTIINDVVRVSYLTQNPTFRTELVACTLATLLGTAWI
ncbi:hypothetical protein M2272_004871 [Mycobacterium frederiksbergense]|uniref:Transposase n=1 Tax=Mycolicibacterium frederiksbergense TaxID=117567 RepID=A0ABT6L7J8_9MYCO|nr:hypothetical protein [Mycolicibacterium frederiksbergense]